MISQYSAHRPRVTVQHYGSASIEGFSIPVAYGSNLMIYTPIIGICDVLRCIYQKEIERILKDPALVEGLHYLPFRFKPTGSDWVVKDLECISVTYLHAWLMGISLDDVDDQAIRQKLLNFRMKAADLLYGAYARPLIPAEIKAEQAQFLTSQEQDRYGLLEGIYAGDHPDFTDDGQPVKDADKGLVIAFSLESPPVEFIDGAQREQYLAIIGILGKLAEQKDRGKKNIPGERGFDRIQAGFHRETGITYYKAIPAERWEEIVRYFIRVYRGFVPRGPLPDVFEIALRTKTKATKPKSPPRLAGL